MNRLQKAAILTELADQLRREGSWCGHTHIQKATYFLQDSLGLPTGSAFILYKHVPYSFLTWSIGELSHERVDLNRDMQSVGPVLIVVGPEEFKLRQQVWCMGREVRFAVPHGRAKRGDRLAMDGHRRGPSSASSRSSRPDHTERQRLLGQARLITFRFCRLGRGRCPGPDRSGFARRRLSRELRSFRPPRPRDRGARLSLYLAAGRPCPRHLPHEVQADSWGCGPAPLEVSTLDLPETPQV